MNLNNWAKKWGVPFEALKELDAMWGIDFNPTNDSGQSESAVQNLVRLEASRKGSRLFRNNVGATYTEDGRFLRYGLANDSAHMNQIIKSSDLIGIRPVKIKDEHVGAVIGQFVAREIKEQGWTYSGNDREKAQLKFIQMITSMGGDACFTDREGSI